MPRVRYFAQAADAAGTKAEELPGATIAEVTRAAVDAHGDRLADVLQRCAVWIDGEPVTDPATPVTPEEEVAFLPPVSGGQ